MQNPKTTPMRLFEATDVLLLDVARKVRLQEAGHKLLVERFDTMTAFVNRPESSLNGKIRRIYPQGGMSIGAGVSSKVDTDEFDIDMIMETIGLTHLSPRALLDFVFDALNGEPGSRYHGKVTRKTRCVTIDYAEMHLDITPATLLANRDPRVSLIPHSKLEEPVANDRNVIANPWGMTDWFIGQVSQDKLFGENYKARFQVAPIPEFVELEMKPLQVIALILLKRFRNLRYSKRDGRMPPSVMLSKMVADQQGSGVSLLEEMEFQTSCILRAFDVAKHAGRLIEVRNPRCREDIFTDRWPKNTREQDVFIADLEHLSGQLASLRTASLTEKRRILVDLFGEHPTAWAYDHFSDSLKKATEAGTVRQYVNTGQIALGLSGVTAHSARALASGVPAAAASVHSARALAARDDVFTVPRTTNFGSYHDDNDDR